MGLRDEHRRRIVLLHELHRLTRVLTERVIRRRDRRRLITVRAREGNLPPLLAPSSCVRLFAVILRTALFYGPRDLHQVHACSVRAGVRDTTHEVAGRRFSRSRGSRGTWETPCTTVETPGRTLSAGGSRFLTC